MASELTPLPRQEPPAAPSREDLRRALRRLRTLCGIDPVRSPADPYCARAGETLGTRLDLRL